MPNPLPNKSKTKPSPQLQEKSPAEKHLGIIAQRAFVHWRRLPASARAYYDAEDMIADVVLHVVKKQARYDHKRAQMNTWVWHVADNCCKSICAHYSAQKFVNCQEVPLAELLPTASRDAKDAHARRAQLLPAAADSRRFDEAREAVERVIEFGSDAVRELLEQIFSGSVSGKPDPETVAELKAVARRNSARLRDFELVYRCADL